MSSRVPHRSTNSRSAPDAPGPSPPGWWSARITRRAAFGTIAATLTGLLAACRGTAAVPTAPPAVPPATGPTVASPSATATAAPVTATPAPLATPVDATQIFVDGTFTADPVSHDFNANPNCGGEPELWAGLLTFTAGLEPTPDWAQTWEVSGDGLTWTFNLRPGNHGWSNGDPVTAADFVWSWQRKLEPATGASDAGVLYAIRNAAAVHAGTARPAALGVSAVDQWTLQVQLTSPAPGFLATVASLATVPAHRASVERFGARWTDAGNCVSNGPFQLDSWEHGVRFQLSVNGSYWGAGNVTLSGVDVPITPAESALLEYRLNRVDQVGVLGTDIAGLQADPTLGPQLQRTIGNGSWALYPNAAVPPFDDPRVRLAVAHAVDRRRLVDLVSGRAVAATSLLPPSFPAHVDDPTVTALQTFDVTAALDALSGTRYAGGTGWPDVTLVVRHEDPDSDLLGRDVGTQLAENLGMPVTTLVLDTAAFDAALSRRSAGLVWERTWFTTPDPASAYGSLFSGPIAGRPTTWQSTEFVSLLASAVGETDPAQVPARFAACERLLQTDVVYVPAAYPATWYLVQPWVGGIPVDRAGYPLLIDRVFTRRLMGLRIAGRPAS